MKFDKQTLSDLAILSSGKDELSIENIFNKAVTEGGKRTLCHFFTTPLDSIDDIVERQDAFKQIIEDIEDWSNYPFSNRLLKNVHLYLSSPIIPIHATNPIELKITKMMYKDNYYQLTQGVLNFRSFLFKMENFYVRHLEKQNSVYLDRIFIRIKSFLSNEKITQFKELCRESDISTTNLYKFDCFFRIDFLDEAKELLDISYKLDVLISLSKVIMENNYNFPIMSPSNTPVFEAIGLYHPFLEDPKCYDIDLSKNNSFVFITGPNMAGKTTFLKSCGIAVYLAQLGLAVPAKSLTLSVFNFLVSSINTEDNIKLGYSYFYSEVRRVKYVAETITSEKSTFIILDELFKGTNIHDAYDASKKVIHGFAKQKSHIYILSSHLVELVNDPKTKELLNCKYFDADMSDGNLSFTYELEEGVSDKRLGLTILEKEKVFEILDI